MIENGKTNTVSAGKTKTLEENRSSYQVPDKKGSGALPEYIYGPDRLLGQRIPISL